MIALVVAAFSAPGSAVAQWKDISCNQVKFKAGIPFAKCFYNFSSGFREIWSGAFHDNASSAYVAVYTAKGGMILEDGVQYALGAEAYRPFLSKYPNRSDLAARGKWLEFSAVVKAYNEDRKMQCLQFFKTGPPRGAGYSWTMVALMCVKEGNVPESAADLVLQNIQVDLK